ncbi:MAG: GGDEF domain-containing protein [Clostridia bacterium]|nr:GGDEF domain-containing protein [Clostridia bacterium]
MATTYVKKKSRHSNIVYTIIATVLICIVFLSLVSSFYTEAEDEAYEMLHLQTKQIKDDLILQIKSDRENLITMANFASKLHRDGENYGLMFESFKSIGLFSNIGILTPEHTFITKTESIDVSGKMSFADEAAKGEYISGRLPDIMRDGKEIIISSVPIKLNNEVVGILYGIINLETIGEKYNRMAKELDAQLFVYDKVTGKFVIDTIYNPPGSLSDFKDREFNEGYSYEELITLDNGFTSFKSIFTGEDLYVHYSTIEDFNWGIMLCRYESQVFAKTHSVASTLLFAFLTIILIIILYLLLVLTFERRRSQTTAMASHIRKLLLEINQQKENVFESLKNIQAFANSRSAFLVDTDGEDYSYAEPDYRKQLLTGEKRKFLVSQIFRYAENLHNVTHATVVFMCITPNSHLLKTDKELYDFLLAEKIISVSFAAIVGKNNHISVLGAINAKNLRMTRDLLEDVAVCFSIAIYNKNHLNRTETAATTDSLTGVLNRVSNKKDILLFDEERPTEFSCIYIDVNELHMVNNKYGHAAGDEMLIFIAKALNEAFAGHRVYRMGGDEFLVFAQHTKQEQIKESINSFLEKLKVTSYKVAIGMSYREQNTNCEEMIREAEIRMYESKAQYYQNKEKNIVLKDADNYVQIKTGIREIDAILSVLKEHYNGIYRVNLETDYAHRILMPAYLGYQEDEKNFSRLLTSYINEFVHPDFHRSVMSFLNYDAIRRQISEGILPKITYKKNNGETVILSVYSLGESEDLNESLWIFSKD